MKRFFILLVTMLVLTGCVSMKSYRTTKARLLLLEYQRVVSLNDKQELNQNLRYENIQKDTTQTKW